MEYFTKLILLDDGWKRNTRLKLSPQGDIEDITLDANSEEAKVIDGVVIPGMPNLHSHAFQRAMAGLAEFAVSDNDDFWSWRQTMYSIANNITPAQQHAIAAQLYMEMLKAGYTSVAEFHYLHHDLDGKAYAHPSEMSDRIIAAAEQTGIGLTLLPVLYMTANLGGAAPQQRQRRFIHTVDTYLTLLDELLARQSPQLQTGIAFHSLRAVPEGALQTVLDQRVSLDPNMPVHIHIAEQDKEVEDCIDAYGCRPVRRLLDNYDVDANWCLIHATHVDPEEVSDMASSACTVGLCPTTEANLGDGLFPLKTYLEADGRFGIGSDSHISVSPIEELRWLEYGQRLNLQKRNTISTRAHPHTGERLWQQALSNCSDVMGRKVNGLQKGNRADLLVLRDKHPLLYGKTEETLLDTLIFSGNESLIKDVMVGGQWLVTDGVHKDEQEITRAYKQALDELRQNNE